MSATDLDSRIAGVLSRTKALPDDVAALLAEVEAALAKAGDELARARSEAFDPMSTTAVIASARGTIFECEFREARLVVARDRLGEKHASGGRARREGGSRGASMPRSVPSVTR